VRIVEEEEDSLVVDELNSTDGGQTPSSDFVVNRSTSPFAVSLVPSPGSTSLVSAHVREELAGKVFLFSIEKTDEIVTEFCFFIYLFIYLFIWLFIYVTSKDLVIPNLKPAVKRVSEEVTEDEDQSNDQQHTIEGNSEDDWTPTRIQRSGSAGLICSITIDQEAHSEFIASEIVSSAFHTVHPSATIAYSSMSFFHNLINDFLSSCFRVHSDVFDWFMKGEDTCKGMDFTISRVESESFEDDQNEEAADEATGVYVSLKITARDHSSTIIL
jgi:hypothetical protein